MTFQCPKCGRTLPDFMQHTGTKCNECVTGKKDKTGSNNSQKSPSSSQSSGFSSKNRSGSTSKHSAEPEVVDTSSTKDNSGKNANTSDSNGSGDAVTPSVSEATKSPSTDSSAQIYQSTTIPQQFSQLIPCDVFALGYYDNESWKSDEYSREIIQYCKNHNTEYRSDLYKQLTECIRLRFDQVTPDTITVYPKHDGGVSEGLVDLAKQVAKQHSMEYNQLLTRTKHSDEQKNKNRLERWKNQMNTIDVTRNLDDEVVLILDDIVTTGASVTVAKTELCNAGAMDAIAVCLGISRKGYGEKRKLLTKSTHSVTSARK